MFQQEVMKKITGQCPQITTFSKRKESRSAIESRASFGCSVTIYTKDVLSGAKVFVVVAAVVCLLLFLFRFMKLVRVQSCCRLALY